MSKEKLSDDEVKSVEEAITEAKKDLESDEIARLDAGHQRLEQALHKVAETLYKSQAGDAAAPGEPEADPEVKVEADDDVVDAEYTEEKTD